MKQILTSIRLPWY